MRIIQRIKLNWHYLLIGLSALIFHGLILLNDGVYWDGWLIYDFLGENNWINLSKMFTENGVFVWTYLHWLMGYLPDVIFGYHLTAFVCIALSGLLIYQIGHLSGFLSRDESLLIALISLVYPAYRVAFELIMLPYAVGYVLFWLAVYLALLAEHKVRLGHWGLRLGALVCFVISFNINSLLVFYFGFLLLLALVVRNLKSLPLKEILTRFLPCHLDYILLPFLYWVLKEALTPRHGYYSTYNQFVSPGEALISLAFFLDIGIYKQFNEALKELLTQPALALLGLLVIWWGVTKFKSASFHQLAKPYALLAFGVLLLGLGIFPYAAVCKSPSLTGWNTRHTLLLALPMALVIVAVVRLLFSAPRAGLSRPGWVLLGMLLLAFGYVTVTNYIGWQARWVKDRSILLQLSTMQDYKTASVFWVDDRFDIGGESFYRFYEWSTMFEQVWGTESYVGLDITSGNDKFLTEKQKYFTDRYNLSTLDPLGCQASLVILNKHPMSNTAMILQYFYYKYLQPEQLDTFLTRLVLLEVKPISAPEATHCVTP